MFALATALVIAGCSAQNDGTNTNSDQAVETDPAPVSGNRCDKAAEDARLKATFDRTADCAADALSAGFAEKINLVGETVSDTKKIVDSFKKLAPAIVVKDLSTARAILCTRMVSDYVTEQTARNVVSDAAAGLSGDEVDAIMENLKGTFSFGVSDLFSAYNDMTAMTNADTIEAFLNEFIGTVSDLGSFVTSCGAVLAPFGEVAIPAISKYTDALGDFGTIGSIANCGFAAVRNGIDVATELSCLSQDLRTIRQQNQTLQSANASDCTDFQSFLANPSVLPLLRDTSNTSDARKNACYGVIHHWGSCVFNAKTAGFFGSRALTCDECTRVCTGYVNGAARDAYLGSVIDGAAGISGADMTSVEQMVFQAAQTCGSNVTPDGLKPCINYCRGQVQDCP